MISIIISSGSGGEFSELGIYSLSLKQPKNEETYEQ